MSPLILIPVILLLQASYFDMQGTITDVISPSAIVVGNDTIELSDVDASGLSQKEYAFLMDDIRARILNKDVFVKVNYVYFDLGGSYNSMSINEMIQEEINDLKEARQYQCDGFSPCLDESTTTA